jgi:hypothetical protein
MSKNKCKSIVFSGGAAAGAANPMQLRKRRNIDSIVLPNPQDTTKKKPSREYKDQLGKHNRLSFKLFSQAKTEVVAKTINLQSEQSIAEHFPLLDGCSNLAVPLHI